jgi:NADH:ubiquinone oxidoreductase subunit 6 (subunit J)
LKKKNPGLSTGVILGAICLLIGIGLFIWAPDFSGFFDRGQDTQPMPIWVILLVLAAINFVYAIISRTLQSRESHDKDDRDERPQEAGRTKQD